MLGEAVGLPEWLVGTLLAVGFIVILGAYAWRETSRQIARTKAKRPSPTREKFIAMMKPDVSESTAEFLWDSAMEDIESWLTPHPDDDLLKDLPIDEDDWSMDWPRAYAERAGFHESNLADWPEGWPPTLRNYGKWLDRSPKA